jgi:hypothetical protein
MRKAFRSPVGDGDAGRAHGIAACSFKSSGSLYCGRSGCGLASRLCRRQVLSSSLNTSSCRKGGSTTRSPLPSVMSYLSPFSQHRTRALPFVAVHRDPVAWWHRLDRHCEGGRRNPAAQAVVIDRTRGAQIAPLGAGEFRIERRLKAENAPIIAAVGNAGDAASQFVAKRGCGDRPPVQSSCG